MPELTGVVIRYGDMITRQDLTEGTKERPKFVFAKVGHIAFGSNHEMVAPFGARRPSRALAEANKLGVFPDWLALQTAQEAFEFNSKAWVLTKLEWVSPHHRREYLDQVMTTSVEVPPIKYDGLTADECFKRYVANMRGDKRSTGLRHGVYPPLTSTQKTVAQTMWAEQLRGLTKASDDKERNRVVVDREFEEWE